MRWEQAMRWEGWVRWGRGVRWEGGVRWDRGVRWERGWTLESEVRIDKGNVAGVERRKGAAWQGCTVQRRDDATW